MLGLSNIVNVGLLLSNIVVVGLVLLNIAVVGLMLLNIVVVKYYCNCVFRIFLQYWVGVVKYCFCGISVFLRFICNYVFRISYNVICSYNVEMVSWGKIVFGPQSNYLDGFLTEFL